jgi:hypothetical protein
MNGESCDEGKKPARDTQFLGFAQMEMRSLDERDYLWLGIDDEPHLLTLFAQYAYDLACHAATHTLITAHGDMSKIPDLTEFPPSSL